MSYLEDTIQSFFEIYIITDWLNILIRLINSFKELDLWAETSLYKNYVDSSLSTALTYVSTSINFNHFIQCGIN